MSGARPSAVPLPAGAAATLACLYEATAAKPGNVHPGASFDDRLTYADFARSAVVVGPIVGRAGRRGVGQTVLDAVGATRAAVGTNTNLGTLLLLAPLAAVPDDQTLAAGIGPLLDGLTSADTRHVYEAIRLSRAGGLGRVEAADVGHDPPPDMTLKTAMQLAADRDLVARQYTNNYADVFRIADALDARGLSLSARIVRVFLEQLAAEPDSLIARKCGADVAREASDRAAAALACGNSDNFDRWLRGDGHRRNPGTSADLVAAGLFVLLREGLLDWTAIDWG